MVNFLKSILKKNKFTYAISVKIYNFLIIIWRHHSKKNEGNIILKKIILRKKIYDKFFHNYGQLNSQRKIEMEKLLNEQIVNFKKNQNGTFMLLEIGSFLGESLELFGNILEKNNIDFNIISLDPYREYNSKQDEDRRIMKGC